MKTITILIVVALFHSLYAEEDNKVDVATHIVATSMMFTSVNSNKLEYYKLASLIREDKNLTDEEKARYKELSMVRAFAYKKALQLQSYVKVDTSIEEYPGILALGRILYHADIYTLRIPTGVVHKQGSYLKIKFTNAGKILAVEHYVPKK